MNKKLTLILSLIVIFATSCTVEDLEGSLTSFRLSYENKGPGCNDTSLKFTFLTTLVDGNESETYTVANSEIVQGGAFALRNRDVLNVKVYVASSDDPLHEVNIPLHFENYTHEQLDASGNRIAIVYCHQEH